MGGIHESHQSGAFGGVLRFEFDQCRGRYFKLLQPYTDKCWSIQRIQTSPSAVKPQPGASMVRVKIVPEGGRILEEQQGDRSRLRPRCHSHPVTIPSQAHSSLKTV